MKLAHEPRARAWPRIVHAAAIAAIFSLSTDANAAGTAVGTVINNTATVDFNLGGTPLSLQSNTTTITVAERLDVVVTLQSPQVLVTAGATNQALLFTVINTGNGDESFALSIDSTLTGDDFNPTPASTSIYFDTNGSGDFNAGDVAYNPGVNDPALAADESVDVFLVNDIPGTVANGQLGFSELTAASVTGIGAPGTVFAGRGDGNTDAVVGATGGDDEDVGEYLVSDVQVSVNKAQAVTDPFGGSQPIPGARITYTITVEVTGAGTATGSELSDPIPTYSTYLPDSITLNGAAISDAIDGDAGEFDSPGGPRIVVRLGDLTSGSGVQTIEFDVLID